MIILRFFLFLLFYATFSPLYNQEHPVNDNSDQNIRIIQSEFKIDQNNLRINDLEIDNNNNVLVATNKALIIIRNTINEEIILSNHNIKCVTTDTKNNIYAINDSQLFFVSSNKKIRLPLDKFDCTDMAYLKGKLWLASKQGLWTYSLNSGKWDSFTKNNSKLRSDHITSLQVDDHNILWIGTDKGYIRKTEKKWDLYDKKENIQKTRGNKEGQWMVSSNNMWLIDEYNRKYQVRMDPRFHQGEINDFIIDTNGQLYMASDILVRYNPYKNEIIRFGHDVGLLSKKCLSLVCDKNNNIWIGTADAGLYRIMFDDVTGEHLTLATILENGISCFGKNDASVLIKASGGKPPYKYHWSNPSIKGNNPHNLQPGEYAVTVIDKNKSQEITSFIIKDVDPIKITIELAKRISLKGSKDGEIKINTSGGKGKLHISWSNGMLGKHISNLYAGSYIAKVTDENDCTETVKVNVRKEKYIPDLNISKVVVGQKLRINELSFAADSTTITSKNFDILDEVYEFLVKNSNVKIEIGGHTNTIPPHSYCDKLSTARAKAVANYIINKGIMASRITPKGYGKRLPLTESTSKAGRKKNQRVEITILSI